MNQIKKIASQIKRIDDEASEIQSHLARCDKAIADLANHEREIAALSEKRDAILAESFIAAIASDTAEIDRRLEELTAKSQLVRESGAAAKLAKPRLEEQFRFKQAERISLTKNMRNAVFVELGCNFAAAEEKYSSAVASLRGALSEMAAVGRAMSVLGGRDGGLAQVSAYRNYLSTKGLAEKHPSAIGGIAMPTWLFHPLGQEEYEALLERLAETGVPVTDLMGVHGHS